MDVIHQFSRLNEENMLIVQSIIEALLYKQEDEKDCPFLLYNSKEMRIMIIRKKLQKLPIEMDNELYLVDSINDILDNCKTVDGYLTQKHTEEYDYALGLIKHGNCFVALKHQDIYSFYPSRFVGYKNNTMLLHRNSKTKDGKDTNLAISKIMQHKPIVNEVLANLYVKYCDSLGIDPDKRKHTFWNIIEC